MVDVDKMLFDHSFCLGSKLGSVGRGRSLQDCFVEVLSETDYALGQRCALCSISFLSSGTNRSKVASGSVSLSNGFSQSDITLYASRSETLWAALLIGLWHWFLLLCV